MQNDVYLAINYKNHDMEADREAVARRLLNESIISEKQFAEVKAYRLLRIFSLHNELQFLLYLSVLLFTTGAGILIYQNIDTIGHTVILALLLAICGICYYLSYKNSLGFSPEEIDFEHPVYNYLVLAATILSCIFIGYLQFQYKVFGDDISIPTFLSAATALTAAYYFDNRSALSIGLTGLAAAIGITVTPKALFENDFFDNPALFYYGIALGLLLIVWAEYSKRVNLKKHFSIIFVVFAQHLICICSVTGMFGDLWWLYSIFLAVATMYIHRQSYWLSSTSLFVFLLIYGYIGLNILLFRLLDLIEAYSFYEVLTLLAPLYFIGSIFLFIRSIKQFNNKTDDSVR